MILRFIGAGLCAAVAGCAHIDFGGEGLLYYEPVPYLFVATNAECVTTASLIMLPGKQKYLKFVSGYGSAELSASLTNGMISAVGQITDTKIAETITSLGAYKAATVAGQAAPQRKKGESCEGASLYLIKDGLPVSSPIPIPFQK